MKIFGLTGGIASGKSVVAAELAALGAVVLDADRAAHQALDLPSVQQALVGRWGDEVLGTDGKIDRGAIAQRVFSDQPNASDDLRFLEETLHPIIREQFVTQLTKLANQGTVAAVIDAPLLLEAGWADLCDSLIFVDSPRDARLGRASLRNWTEEEFTKREACQMPIAEKRQQSSHILANCGTLADLRDQVQAFWASFAAESRKT